MSNVCLKSEEVSKLWPNGPDSGNAGVFIVTLIFSGLRSCMVALATDFQSGVETPSRHINDLMSL